jgi:uncharacterized OB-fold protein
MPRVIPPAVDADDEYFWAGVREHRLLLQRCTGCGTLRHPPSPMCGRCHATTWDTQEAQGTGTVHSWIVSRHPSGDDEDARVVVLVDLAEGLRFVANLVDTPFDEVRNEMPVELCFREYDGVVLPQFRPAAGAA